MIYLGANAVVPLLGGREGHLDLDDLEVVLLALHAGEGKAASACSLMISAWLI